jgi:Bacterial SH3 domain
VLALRGSPGCGSEKPPWGSQNYPVDACLLARARLRYHPGIDVLPTKEQAGRTKSRSWPIALGLALAGLLLASGCGSSGHDATATTAQTTTARATVSRVAWARRRKSVPTTKRSTTTTTTRPASAVGGPDTVLSPIGLNVRAGPSKSAKVIATAAQGTVFQLLGHTDKDGGWDKVRGSTVTGWISSDLGYAAPGRFGYYSSSAFNVLFPAGWTSAGKPEAGVVFRAPAPSSVEVVVTTSSSVATLPTVSQGAGISENSSEQVVACGVTSHLYSYSTSSPDKYYADALFSLAAGHALGLKATLTSMSQMRTVLDFVNSISFPLPICVGK